MKTVKFIAPIYGVKPLKQTPLHLENGVAIRSVNLLQKEHEVFKKYGLLTGYDAVFEIDYRFDKDDPSEPYPGISLRLLNILDAALVVYGEGRPGIAAIIPASKLSGYLGHTISRENPRYEECLDKDIDEQFAEYFSKFKKAYDMRPMAFDIFRRSQERFANNDKTIDSCTVLESILVPRGEKSKKSFILGGLKIMGYSHDEIKRIDDLVEYRNAIIHADREKILKLLSGRVYTFAWFEETFNLVRKILYRYAENPWD